MKERDRKDGMAQRLASEVCCVTMDICHNDHLSSMCVTVLHADLSFALFYHVSVLFLFLCNL